jgi:hypothetical protein
MKVPELTMFVRLVFWTVSFEMGVGNPNREKRIVLKTVLVSHIN